MAARLSIVVTTLAGRPAEFRRLLDSITAEQLDGIEIIVVDQSPGADAHLIARAHLAGSGIRLVCITSEIGVNRGRNAGIAAAAGMLVTLPDDDAWYPRGGLTAILRRIEGNPGLDGLTFVARGSDGHLSSTSFDRRAGPIRRGSVFRRGLESAMVFRTDAIRSVGGFDPTIGVGAGTPWAAAEGPELLYRMLNAGASLRFDPALFVHHEDPLHPAEDMVARVRGYSRATGYVVSRNHMVVRSLDMLLIRPAIGVVVAAIRGQRQLARCRLARIAGHMRGVLDGRHSRTARAPDG